MSYKVIPTSTFKKEAKRLIKKFPSLKNELLDLSKSLAESPETGTPLGNNTFKIRVAIQSKGKGKSGGARVITYVVTADEEVYLLTIYDKSDLANVDDKTLKTIIKKLASD
ncbi:type II toxin-antitoxin system RelE/ParE family toxin [Parasegetibacter sp. NRK P23]|uniref:type II toxin-antitoxin system RelE/ParE family toxin n=1 Tax=Parasegetibacter sp. NRK P23 TaxID=2942999 RepID=UPI002042C373|nr:type II toxin-antitoxin system RelE/ParE family toxin [Parasegetibacter sp. NRK P23]MCM5530315.1 type II toxin-antitoxin system RelE/ParE family toxin [Parasegetibacter sp. NRK P23]